MLGQRFLRFRDLRQQRDFVVQADRRQHDRHRHHHRRQRRHRGIAIAVENSHRMRRVGHQEHAIGQRQHRQPATPAEQIAIGEHPGALVIVRTEFGPECRGRNLERRQSDPHQERTAKHIETERRVRPMRRVPQEQPSDRHRQRRGVHPRVSSPPAPARMIRQIADQRIDKRLDHQRRHDRHAHQPGRQADHLIVEQQQEGRETAILHPISDRAEPERPAAARAESSRRRDRQRRGHAANASRLEKSDGTFGSQL